MSWEQDAGGITYSADIGTASSFLSYQKLSPLSSIEQYPPGVEFKTAVLFDVNPDAKGLKLVLKQANNSTIALE